MSSGQVQHSFSLAVALTTASVQTPFTLPGGYANALFITANVAGLQVTTIDGTLINISNGALIGTLLPIKCKSWQSTAGSFVALQ
jgi:hypothetical protein